MATITSGLTRFRQTSVDLSFVEGDKDVGRAALWLPEMVLPGNTDRGFEVQGAVHWEDAQGGELCRYEHENDDGSLLLKAEVKLVELGWQITLTIGNGTEETWPNVVGAVCLQLPAAHSFDDPGWHRTHFRSGGQFLNYHGCKIDGGLDTFRMSLVDGHHHLERSQRHRDKWGFTQAPSDDGIIGVASDDGSTTLTTTWQQVHHLQVNRLASFRCIHANPHFGDLQSGQDHTVHGCVLAVAGDLDSAWAQTAQFMKNITVANP